MMWMCMRKMDPLRWTPYMDDCVTVLLQGKETENDIMLATIAKCHATMVQMTNFPAQWDPESESRHPPPIYFVKAMQLQLQNISRSLPAHLQTNKVLLLHTYGAEVIIKEGILTSQRSKEQQSSTLSNLQRLEGLNSIVIALERWFDAYFDIPMIDWIGVPFCVHFQFGHSIMLLFKLNILDEPGWDPEELRKRIDLLEVLERGAQRLDDISKVRGVTTEEGDSPEEPKSILRRAPKLLRRLAGLLKAELERCMEAKAQTPSQVDTQSSGYGSASSASSTAEFGTGALIPDDVMMNLVNDPWVADMFNTWWEF